MRPARALFGSAVTMLVVAATSAACGDLKVSGDPPTDADAGDGAAPDGSSASADGKGPGPHGSLPSGYCCTADSECRYRHCVDMGTGGHMCLDECEQDAFCTRPDITFTCDSAAKRCQPTMGFTCLAAAGFSRGAKPLGACCNATVGGMNDGTAGSDCEGNQCAAVGDGPLVCTNRCSFASDCSGGDAGTGFACILFGTTKACVPTSPTYTCQ